MVKVWNLSGRNGVDMTIATACEGGENFGCFSYCRTDLGRMRELETLPVAPGGMEEFAKQLLGLQVDLLIISRLPESLARELESVGISVISGITGANNTVLNSYLAGTLKF